MYEKIDEGNDDEAETVAAAADVQSSSDVDELSETDTLMSKDVLAADVYSGHAGTVHVSFIVYTVHKRFVRCLSGFPHILKSHEI